MARDGVKSLHGVVMGNERNYSQIEGLLLLNRERSPRVNPLNDGQKVTLGRGL
jgi:hypothetical protein